jgi:hypothetical protein
MKINFYNYTLAAKRMNNIHYQLIQFTEENNHLKFDILQNLIQEKFNPYGSEFGMITINTKTLALLKLNKKEIKSIIFNQGSHSYIYNKDFKKIIQRINKHIGKEYNIDLSILRQFFKCSLVSKSEYIVFNLLSNEI